MLKIFALFLTLLVSALPVAAAPVKARIPSGIGILLINKAPAGINSPIVIYKEPSLGRLAELEPRQITIAVTIDIISGCFSPCHCHSKKIRLVQDHL